LKNRRIVWVTVLLLLACGGAAWAQAGGVPIPRFSVGITDAKKPQEVAQSLQLLVLLTVLSLAPGFLILMTGFTRIIIVLGFLRNALGTQQMPPNQVLLSFALFLTILIMAPIFNRINAEAVQPYLDGKITQMQAFEKGGKHIRSFMLRQTREKDLRDGGGAFHPVPGHRHGHRHHPHVHGHDDAAAGADLLAVQDPAVRHGGRLASGGAVASDEL
jgi:flagellar biosynthetic protein FliP